MTDDDTDWLTPLRAARDNLAMSMTTLAKQSGVSYPTVQATLTGKSLPRGRVLRALVGALLPDGSAEGDAIIERYLRASGAAPVDGGGVLTPYYARLLIDTLRDGLGEIADAIRDSHPAGADHH